MLYKLEVTFETSQDIMHPELWLWEEILENDTYVTFDHENLRIYVQDWKEL